VPAIVGTVTKVSRTARPPSCPSRRWYSPAPALYLPRVTPAAIDLEAPAAIREPATYFARAREHGDVQWSDAHHAWVILSHAECEAAFRETVTLSADRTGSFARAAAHHSAAFSVVVELLSGWMNFRDPPVHTRLREPVRAAFTPRAVSRLEQDIQEIVDETMDAFAGDVIDLQAAFARPIPATVIAALLGVTGIERRSFERWSDDLGRIVFATQPGATEEAPIVAAAGEFTRYFSGLIEKVRTGPDDTILSALVHHASDELSAMELVGACTLLLFGGHETTTTLLGNAIAMLLERPDLQTWLRDHPESWETAIDEFMRTVGPARAMPRKVARDHVRGGAELHTGQTAYIGIVSANHDPAVFLDPSAFDPLRDPNPHLGFGWGLHFCLGANLARLEARVALRRLFERYSWLEPAVPVPEVRASIMGFGRRPLLTRLQP
jgi:cytochrome P450